MLNKLISSASGKFLFNQDKTDELYEVLLKRYGKNDDPWGLNLKNSRKSFRVAAPIYKNYFKTRVFGSENVEDRPYVVISNHSGQIPFDGMILSCAFLLDVFPPRVLRTMVERFVTTLPFFSSFVNQNGGVLGDRTNCSQLLKRGESVLVFPEGLKGISKNTHKFYQLQSFTKGFYRLAIKSGVQILPVAVVGAEEFYPLVYHPRKMAQKFGLPALPLTPLFPLTGPLGAIPLPSPVDVIIGKPYTAPSEINEATSDEQIIKEVKNVQQIVSQLVGQGIKNRRPFWATKLVHTLQEINNKK